jgi:hypothetical protein
MSWKADPFLTNCFNILYGNHTSASDLERLSEVIEYISLSFQLNQLELFVVEDNKNRITLRPTKSLQFSESDQAVTLGEGLLGQACLDQEVIILRSIPSEYLFTSNAGEERNHLIIMPICLSGVLYGAIEGVSSKDYLDDTIFQLEKISQLLAEFLKGRECSRKLEKLERLNFKSKGPNNSFEEFGSQCWAQENQIERLRIEIDDIPYWKLFSTVHLN